MHFKWFDIQDAVHACLYQHATCLCVLLKTQNRITRGIPACTESSAAANAVNGVSSEGFTTTVHPHARAGATWHRDKQSDLHDTSAGLCLKKPNWKMDITSSRIENQTNLACNHC